MKHTQVAIVGASFGGLSAYRKVKKCCGADVKLFDMRDKFTWIPGLHETLGNPQRLNSLQFDLHKVYKQDFIHQKVTEITENNLITQDGTEWTFDYAVIATGSSTNFFGKEDFAAHCYTLRYPDDVPVLNQALPHAKHISVIGGGFTGIEIASVLAKREHNAHVRLVHSQERLVNRLCNFTSNKCKSYLEQHGVEVILNNRLEHVTRDSITLADGSILPSDITILSSGISINDQQHRPYLTFDGYTARESDNIYSCGDVAIHGLYTTAHNAVLEGRRVGQLISDKIQNKEKTYPPLQNRDKLAIALGDYDGIITVGKRGVYIPWLTGFAKRMIEKKVMFEFKTGILFPF